MRTYDVTQTICRERILRVEANSMAEAIERAQKGYGEIVSNERKGGLLCSSARLVPKREAAVMRER